MTLTLASSIFTKRERWLASLAERQVISTPSLVIDSGEVKNVLALFEKHLPEAKLFYAMKANNAPALLQFMSAEGVSFDVASATEINDLHALGVAPSRMVLSNPVKSPATINAFFDNGLKLVSIDNAYDLRALQAAQSRNSSKGKVGVFVRIRIPTTDVQIDLNSKFGCTEEEAVSLLKEALDCGFWPRGIQFHVGTQSWNTHNYQIGIETSLRIIDTAQREFGIKCDSINIGGGFPDPSVAKEAGGLDNFFINLAQTIAPAVKRGLNIIAEPGRILVSGACSAVCSVIGKSVRNGTPWLYLDDGAYGLFSGKFFDHKEYQFRVLSQQTKPKEKRLVPYVIAGPTCDSIDIVAQPTLLPSDLGMGDILCSHNMGAYSIVTACSFNGFGRINTYLGTPSEQDHAANDDREEVRKSRNFRIVGNS